MTKQSAPDAQYYAYSVHWSAEDEVFIGRVAEFAGLAAHGDTPSAALAEITEMVRFAIEDLIETGDHPVPEPIAMRSYSGKLLVRLGKPLHRDLTLRAARAGLSINQLVGQELSRR